MTGTTFHRLSFAIGLLFSIGLMVFPFVLHGISPARVHAGLPVLMIGVVGTFVYGIGYQPTNIVPRIVFSPYVAWTLIALGASVLLGR